MRRVLTVVLAVFATGWAAKVEASPVTWFLDGVTFADGSKAVGSFDFDVLNPILFLGSYTNTSIDVIEQSNSSVFHYAQDGVQGNSHEVSFGNAQSPGGRMLLFDIDPSLFVATANGLGVVSLDPFFSLETNITLGTSRHIVAGNLTTVPEPDQVALLLVGLGGLMAMAWTRRRPIG